MPKEKKSYSPDEAYAKAASYCALAERSTADLQRKFRDWGVAGELHEALIDRLHQEGFLDPERFVRAFVRDKYRFNGWGPVRLRQELRKHRISSQLIDSALAELEEELEEEEDDQLQRILTSKLRTIPRSLERRKVFERLMRFGLYRGYPLDEVREVVLELLEGDPEEES